jgi:PIN domain nuclease of toxin-antitoxin system
MLAHRGRIELDAPPLQWLESVAALPNVRLLPLDVQLCVTAANLPDPIRDPADRLIVATALQQGVPLVTKDARIHESRIVPTIW